MPSESGKYLAPILSEADFLRHHAAEIEHGLFLARFPNWRLSVAGAIGIAWVIGGMYNYLVPATEALMWSVAVTVVFALIGISCLLYERFRPGPESPSQRRWLGVWTVGSAAGGGITGLLGWFLPAERVDLQLSAAAIVATLMIVFALARAHRPLVFAMVGAQTLAMCAALALHAQLLFPIPVILLQAGFVLVFSQKFSGSMRAAIGQRLYAQHLLSELQRSQARQMMVQQRESAINERQRMLAELQDGLGTQLLAAQRALEGGRIDSILAASLLRECVVDLRLLTGNDGPATRSLGTLLGMLRNRVQRNIETAGLQLHWRVEDQFDAGTLPGGQALDLLRILQEAIENVLLHAAARQIFVTTSKSARELEIAVEDNGRGFNPREAMHSGKGIASMQRRAARLGATLEIEGREGGGTAMRLRMRLPLGGVSASGARGAA
jgi:signal transduction histidine kinase